MRAFRSITPVAALLLALACTSAPTAGDVPGDTPVEVTDTTTDSAAPEITAPDDGTSTADPSPDDVKVRPPADASEPGADFDAPEGDTQPPPFDTCAAPAASAMGSIASVPPGFCPRIWADGLDAPRGIAVADNGDVLVVERGKGQVTLLWDDDGNGVSDPAERATLAAAPGLNHGLAIHGGYLWASSTTTVYRWPWQAGGRSDLGAPQVVITGIPDGGHATRPMVFDAEGRMYVDVGSGSNVDASSARARIRRFDVATVPAGGLAFDAGELFADGLRNEVGLAFDLTGRLWGVENGRDNLARPDLGDVHQDNPAEELNLFVEPGRFYGYPYCWSEGVLPAGIGDGPGTQWADPASLADGTHDDAWCRNPANVVPPRLAMKAHSAPLGLVFYRGDAFPADAVGDAFVTFHGSWNANPATGYKVVRVRFDATGNPTGYESFLECSSGVDVGWPHRPVGVAVGHHGELLVTSDASGVVMAIGYQGTASAE